MQRRCEFLLAVTGLLLPLLARSAEPLRYRFNTGDWYIYEREITASDRPPVRDRIELWCLDTRPAEMTLLVNTAAPTAGESGRGPADERRDSVEAARGVLVRIDPAGLPTFPAEMLRSAAELEPLFDLLPITQGPFDPADAWRSRATPARLQWQCRTEGGGAVQKVDFRADDLGGMVAASGLDRSGSFWFDRVRGVVNRVDCTELSPGGRRLTTSIRLKHHVRNDEKWCAQRVDEARAFLGRCVRQEALLDDIVFGRVAVADAVAANRRGWVAYVRDLPARAQSPFAPLAEARALRLEQAAPALVRLRDFAAGVLDRPAFTWALQDAHGATWTSEEVRSGWTLECFWSARNVASLRMLETLRTAGLDDAVTRAPESQEPPKPRTNVRTIGLNVDADPLLAARAMESCGHGFPQLLAESLVITSLPPELPYVRLIDPAGVVRGVFFGWRPDIGAQVDGIVPGR